MPDASPDRTDALTSELHIVALCSFAVAGPLLDIIARNPEFLVAHQATPLLALTLALAVATLPPALLILLDLGAGAISHRVHQIVHHGTLALLVSVFALPPLKKILPEETVVLLGLAALLGAGVPVLLAHIRVLRTFLAILAIGLVIFPSKFLFLSPVTKILLPDGTGETSGGMTLRSPHDVVLLVFDEMDAGILLDKTGEIDAHRFPNFATFANEAHWFHNATTVDNSTVFAVPAIVSGNYPRSGRLATFEDYPATIFSFLSDTHAMNVSEAVTNLLPPELRGTGSVDDEGSSPVSALVSDLAVVFGHVVLPSDLAGTLLPSIAGGWKGFGRPTVVKESSPVRGRRSKRVRQVETFIEGITRRGRPTFHFLHVLLPHHHYDFTSTGKFYAPVGVLDGLEKDPRTGLTNRWIDDQRIVDLGYQRYLLQTGFTDRLFGRIIDRLKDQDIYEDSMIVVTADHGVSFRAGDSIRAFSAHNYREVLTVPMFVKLPGQSTSVQSDAYVESIDVVPTILEALGVEALTPFDGRSMITGSFSDRIEKPVFEHGRKLSTAFVYEDVTSSRLLSRQFDVLGSGTALTDLSIASIHGGLLGHRVTQFNVEVADHVEFELDRLAALRNVDLQSAFLPLYQSGRLREPTYYQLPIDVALAVNGTIAATTRLSSVLGSRPEFRAVLPESSLVQGRNDIEIYLLREGGDGIALTRGRRVLTSRADGLGRGRDPGLRAATRVVGAAELLRTATEATIDWPGTEWKYLAAQDSELRIVAPNVWDEPNETRLVVAVGAGEHRLTGEASLRPAAHFPVVFGLELDLGSDVRVGLLREVLQPGDSVTIDQYFSVPSLPGAGGGLKIFCRMVDRARNNWSAGVSIRGLELRSWDRDPVQPVP